MTVYLSIDELIQINLEMVEAFDGTSGVRDRGHWRRRPPGLKLVTTET
jgi:hypothetical protein